MHNYTCTCIHICTHVCHIHMHTYTCIMYTYTHVCHNTACIACIHNIHVCHIHMLYIHMYMYTHTHVYTLYAHTCSESLSTIQAAWYSDVPLGTLLATFLSFLDAAVQGEVGAQPRPPSLPHSPSASLSSCSEGHVCSPAMGSGITSLCRLSWEGREESSQ